MPTYMLFSKRMSLDTTCAEFDSRTCTAIPSLLEMKGQFISIGDTVKALSKRTDIINLPVTSEKGFHNRHTENIF